VAAAQSGTIRTFRAVDGTLLWQRDLSAAASGPPELAGDRVYVPTRDGLVVALQIDTGAPLWARWLGGAPGEILALDERLYVGSTDNYFYCLRTSDGEVAWRWRTGADVLGRPVADDRRVYFVSLDNVLRALTRGGGSQEWRRLLPIRPSGGPLMTAGALVVSGVAPSVLAFSTTNGNPAGALTTRGELASPPYIVDTAGAPTIVVVTRDLEGATVTAFTRSFEPAVVPLTPLPDPTPVPAPILTRPATP
jgi:outer membrane protein assembly factor BamB